MKEILIQIVAGIGGLVVAFSLWQITRMGRRVPLSDESFDRLWVRHRTTYFMTYPAAFVGILFPLWMYKYGGYLSTDWRPAGLTFGLIIALPLAVVAARTLPYGTECLSDFWRMYLHRYNAGAAGIALLFGSCLIVGLVAFSQL